MSVRQAITIVSKMPCVSIMMEAILVSVRMGTLVMDLLVQVFLHWVIYNDY